MSATPPNREHRAQANRRLALRLAAVSVVFLGFGFALVPLYDVFCRVVGINVQAAPAGDARPEGGIDTGRWVNIEFSSQVMAGLPVVFRPLQTHMRVNPGDVVAAKYLVRNPTDRELHANAVYSVSPGNAGAHFKKIECFCFQEQTLAPGEEREMPVIFWVDRKLAANVTDITLSYAFYSQPAGKAK